METTSVRRTSGEAVSQSRPIMERALSGRRHFGISVYRSVNRTNSAYLHHEAAPDFGWSCHSSIYRLKQGRLYH